MNPSDSYKIRCMSCGTKNRVPGTKIDAIAKCGRCKSALKTDELFLPQPITFSDPDFNTKVLQSPIPVLVFFWAPWCATCGAVTPIIDEFAMTSKGKIRVGKINVDANPQTSGTYDIMSVPILLVFDNGKLQERIMDSMQKHDIMMKMARYL